MFRPGLQINVNNNKNKNINMLNRPDIIRLLNEKINNKEILHLAITIYNKLENNEEISTDILINMLYPKNENLSNFSSNNESNANSEYNEYNSNNEYNANNEYNEYNANNEYNEYNALYDETNRINNSSSNSRVHKNNNSRVFKKVRGSNNLQFNNSTDVNTTSFSLNNRFNINSYILKSRESIKNIKTVVREVVRDHPIFYEIYHLDNIFFKLYQFNDYMNYVNFILEVTFQIYTYYILQEYLPAGNIILTTPKILKCYKVDKSTNLEVIDFRGALSFNYFFYIEMESAEGDSLKSISSQLKNKNCSLFTNIIEYLDTFLKEYDIFHNDLNRTNIFIKRSLNNGKIIKITIIDFGQSLDKPHSNIRAQFKYECNNKKGVILKKRNLF